MIYLDANIMLLAVTQANDPVVRLMNEHAKRLMRQVERDEVAVTTCDAVIAEVAYVLTSRANFNLPAADAAQRIASLVRLRGFKLHDKGAVLSALDMWQSNARLGFVDALIASHARNLNAELATFDRHFDNLPGIVRWQPDADESNGTVNPGPAANGTR